MTAKELEKIFARYVLKRWLVLKSKAQTLRLRPRLRLRLGVREGMMAMTGSRRFRSCRGMGAFG